MQTNSGLATPEKPTSNTQEKAVADQARLSRIETPPEGVPLPADALFAQWEAEAAKGGELEDHSHMASCPANGGHGRQCVCPANLERGYTAKEKVKPNLKWAESMVQAYDALKKQVEAVNGPPSVPLLERLETQRRAAESAKGFAELELWRVDDSTIEMVKRYHPQEKRDIEVPVTVQPLWLCPRCGWAARCERVSSHHCDPEALQWSASPPSYADRLPMRVLTDGTYRLTVWRDKELHYHLGEEVVLEGRVVGYRELGVDPDLDVFLARQQDALLGAYLK